MLIQLMSDGEVVERPKSPGFGAYREAKQTPVKSDDRHIGCMPYRMDETESRTFLQIVEEPVTEAHYRFPQNSIRFSSAVCNLHTLYNTILGTFYDARQFGAARSIIDLR